MLDSKYTFDYCKKSAKYLEERVKIRPKVALVLGSCLGNMADLIENPQVIDYKDIPNFPITTVASHAGKMIFGRIAGKEVVCMSGRFHFYEGYDFEELAVPVRVLRLFGVEKLILTNAAGAINERYVPGDIMLISDHIKLFGASPLRGPNAEEFGPRFFDVTDMYTYALQEVARNAAERAGITLREGVYYYASGPQFETPAEIRAFRVLGADAVGMSTVTEAITAAHCGMQLLAFSLITNMAAGVLRPVSSQEVDDAAEEAAPRFQKLITEVLCDL